jgi:predicted RNA binding protein YcfA (HicA-like mRNA interferase family)/predicted RNase H-like HicB family nuclease
MLLPAQRTYQPNSAFVFDYKIDAPKIGR